VKTDAKRFNFFIRFIGHIFDGGGMYRDSREGGGEGGSFSSGREDRGDYL